MSDDIQNYNTVSRIFHWSVALLILGLLIVGFFMEGMNPEPLKFKIYGWHKALGMVVIGLGVARIIWKHASQSPNSLSTHKKWEKMLSKTIHIVLYILIIAMPLSGWIMSSAGGYPVSFFGLFEFPNIVEKNKELGRIANQVHGILAYALVGCVGLHVVGAIKHHVIDKDVTLNRMGGNLIFAVLGVLALAVAFFIPTQRWFNSLLVSQTLQVESVQSTDAE